MSKVHVCLRVALFVYTYILWWSKTTYDNVLSFKLTLIR